MKRIITLLVISLVLFTSSVAPSFDLDIITDQYMDYCNLNQIRAAIIYEDVDGNFIIKQNSKVTFNVEVIKLSNNGRD